MTTVADDNSGEQIQNGSAAPGAAEDKYCEKNKTIRVRSET